ncbi:peptidyl-prolyl cis-trans isomerase [Metabacillus malikii]|uniref:peptidylprolyl isomerase n=1 Tax=Metabacillus malikii TaxID=1504265 RepID=A0ABT9ZND6_9BACI|nr:peptidyl-prolyl cis-trans isomerase [Metabacillus malikii]MDQ0233301.1 foldase protein PrsA [Metabacillus malikii]
MSGKVLWGVIFGLVVLNCFTLAYFTKTKDVYTPTTSEESIATVGEESITKQEWLDILEERYGKEILTELINKEVVMQLAEEHQIKVSEEDIEREFAVYQAMNNSKGEGQLDVDEIHEQIRYSILLEELLTKDVSVSEQELKEFYEMNKDSYSIEDSYHLAHIVVETKEAANHIIKELENGSSFDVLALEKSTDEFTAHSGGDIGFVSEKNDFIPKAYIDSAHELSSGEWSKPIRVDTGYAILFLHKKQEGKSYSYGEVKSQIRRQIALEQMQGNVTVEPLWNEVGVKWIYGD